MDAEQQEAVFAVGGAPKGYVVSAVVEGLHSSTATAAGPGQRSPTRQAALISCGADLAE